MDAPLDLTAYLARVGIEGPIAADVEGLRLLHRAHVGSIPFENIDVQAGREIRLDLESLQRKLVQRRRGGYCFEQNTLFAAVLRALGFDVDTCEARVRPEGDARVLGRTHMALVVRLDRRAWLCDVGFGADGPFEPIPLDSTVLFQIDRDVRVSAEGRLLVLQSRRAGDWRAEYAFIPEPVYPIDFEIGNWHTSTHPSSVFRQRLTAQITRPDARHALRQLTYTISRASGDEVREIPRAGLPALLADVFGLRVADAVFPAVDGSGAAAAI